MNTLNSRDALKMPAIRTKISIKVINNTRIQRGFVMGAFVLLSGCFSSSVMCPPI